MTTNVPAGTPLPEPETLAQRVGQLLDEARRRGADAAAATVAAGRALSVTVRLDEVESLEQHRNRSLAVAVYFGQRKGTASTSDWRPEAIRDTVDAACAIARHTASDPCAGLPDPDRLARDVPDLDLYHPWALEAPEAIELARACETAAREHDARIANSEGASVAAGSSLHYHGNSLGFGGGYRSSRHSIGCSMVARDEAGMQRDHWFSIARDPAALEEATAVGRRAAERAVARLGARRLGTRQVPVLFVPELARGLLGHFVGAISGGALYRKASFLRGRVGERIFPAHVTLSEQPHLPRALGSAPFDAEGVETRNRDLVRDGVLQGYVLDSYSARRLGLDTTGNAGGIHNLSVVPGPHDFAALLRELDTGLVVTQLMGQGINLLTGDYSRGASGFWVERGEIRHPVEEVTIAGNLEAMLSGVVAVGNDIDRRGSIRTGSLLIERMTVAGD
ncbi:MAG: metalloprotease PmbA [Candidatus Competibacterales bacterium]|nr:metalloprotease PmbA [Candidatus Competibacterales bacterium]